MEEKMGVIKKFQALSSTNDVLAVCNAKPPSPPLRKHPPKRVACEDLMANYKGNFVQKIASCHPAKHVPTP